MLNPFSPGVLGAAAIVSSPALLSAFQGTMPIDVALTRYLITVLLAWGLLSMAKAYVLAARQETRRVLQEIASEEAAAKAAAEAAAVQAGVGASADAHRGTSHSASGAA